MPNKTKTSNQVHQRLADVAAQGGILLMATAATIGMLPVPEHPDKRAVVPNQPAFAFAPQSGEGGFKDNNVRREREETGPHYISYSVTQRTPGRAGRL